MDANERAQVDLRAEIAQLLKAREVLEGLVLVDPGEANRLALVEQAITEKTAQLADLQLEERRPG